MNFQIIRALFCVSIDNSDAKDRYKPEKTTEELDKAVAISESSAVKVRDFLLLSKYRQVLKHMSRNKMELYGKSNINYWKHKI